MKLPEQKNDLVNEEYVKEMSKVIARSISEDITDDGYKVISKQYFDEVYMVNLNELKAINEQLNKTKTELLEQIKEFSKMNGELRREKHDLEDKLIALQIEWQDLYHEANKSWFVKLNDKLSKLGIRNPFYIK